jgi:hypothetical protein
MTHLEVNFGGVRRKRSDGPQLDARFMLPDRRECRCKIAGLSVDGALFITSERPPVGTSIIAYITSVGRTAGYVAGLSPAGLLVRFSGTEAQRMRIREQLSVPATGEQRRAPRVVLHDANSVLMANGESVPCVVRDISLTGAALLTKLRPAVESTVYIGRMKGRVVRHFDGGIAIEFIPMRDA